MQDPLYETLQICYAIFLDELWTHDTTKDGDENSKRLKNLATNFDWWKTTDKSVDVGTGGDGEFEWRIPADSTGYIEIDRDGKQY